MTPRRHAYPAWTAYAMPVVVSLVSIGVAVAVAG
jgi:hypothetical protein